MTAAMLSVLSCTMEAEGVLHVDDLPEIKAGDDMPEGPYTLVHEDGTRQAVFAGPNYRTPQPKPSYRQRANWWLRRHWGWIVVPALTAICAPFTPRLVHALYIEAGVTAAAAAFAAWRTLRNRR